MASFAASLSVFTLAIWCVPLASLVSQRAWLSLMHWLPRARRLQGLLLHVHALLDARELGRASALVPQRGRLYLRLSDAHLVQPNPINLAHPFDLIRSGLEHRHERMVLAVLVSVYVSISTMLGLMAHLVIPTFTTRMSRESRSVREKLRKIEGEGLPRTSNPTRGRAASNERSMRGCRAVDDSGARLRQDRGGGRCVWRHVVRLVHVCIRESHGQHVLLRLQVLHRGHAIRSCIGRILYERLRDEVLGTRPWIGRQRESSSKAHSDV